MELSNEHLNRIVSEQILQLAEVVAKGSDVFGNKKKFIDWLHYPNMALGNRTPLSLLKSKFGVDIVLDELGRIEHASISDYQIEIL